MSDSDRSDVDVAVEKHPWRSKMWWACGELEDGRITRDRAIAQYHLELGHIVYRCQTFQGAVQKARRRIHLLNPDGNLYYLLPNARVTKNSDNAFEEYRSLETQGSCIITTDSFGIAEEALDHIVKDLNEDMRSSVWSKESSLDSEEYV